MDFKNKSYHKFSGLFLQTEIKVSQKCLDEMCDGDVLEMRQKCVEFESSLYNLLQPYAVICHERETSPITQELPIIEAVKAVEETNPKKSGKQSKETE